MSWVAKNSKTGEVYGKVYDSIYECSSYIEKKLYILEYLYQRIDVIESHIKNKEEFDRYLKEKYPDGCSFITEMVETLTYAINDVSKDIHDTLTSPIKEIARDNYIKNNIIRCYYVEQERFATGFDF